MPGPVEVPPAPEWLPTLFRLISELPDTRMLMDRHFPRLRPFHHRDIPRRRLMPVRPTAFSLAIAGMLLGLSGVAGAFLQDEAATSETAPDRLLPEARPETTDPGAIEPQPFSSVEAGFELTLPDGIRQPSDDPNTLAVVTNPEDGWQFEVQRLALSTPAELESRKLPEGGRQAGLLELIADDIVRDTNADVLRQEVTPLGDGEAGVLAVRYSVGTATQLQQIALIPASDLLYYRLVLTSPAPSGDTEELAGDENVKKAVRAFGDALNTFKRLDQQEIRDDQEQRLFRTRALFVNLTRPTVLHALEDEQWWRIRKEGEDIGWAYVQEHPADGIPDGRRNDGAADALSATGVRVGIRTHLTSDSGTIDRFTWSWAAFDRNEEKFLEESVLQRDGEIEQEGFVVGSMTGRKVPKKVRVPRSTGAGFDEVMEIVDDRRLEVSVSVGDEPPEEPTVRELPAWYLQQAMTHLFPRLVAPWGQRTYLVAVYDPTRTEVWQQYVDVEGPRNETINGQKQLVMVVTTRMGLSGNPTTHYISTGEYRWLGSVNEATGVQIQPVDRQTIQKIWGAEIGEGG